MRDTDRTQTANGRELVLDILMTVARQQEYSHIVIRSVLEKYDYLEAREKGFIKRLAEGTLERQIQLDDMLNRVSSVKVNKMKPLIRCLLRMSVYQMMFMDSVPDSAVCNEAVKLAKKRGFGSLTGFVNGVLRNLGRRKAELMMPAGDPESAEYLSVKYSMPRWIVDKWIAEQGRERTERILTGLLVERPVTVRADSRLTTPEYETLKSELESDGVTVHDSGILPCAWYLENTEGLKRLHAFASGKLKAQDVSSMLAVMAADIHAGDLVVDVCAAPGGKTFFASELAGTDGHVISRDVSEYKLSLLQESKDNFCAENVEIQMWDGREYDEKLEEKADVVLADVPCSGLGVIGRKKDIKYRVTPESIASLPKLQKEILTNAQRYVRPGGVLLFSTCTINKEENEEILSWLLSEFPFHAESIAFRIPECILREEPERESAGNGYLQLLPGIHGTDGFFLARLVKDGGI